MSDADATAYIPPGQHAARLALHAKLKANYARTAAAGQALAKVVQRAGNQTDLVLHYADVTAAILALEELADAATAAAKELRVALMVSLLDTGCPQVATDDFTVYLAAEPAFLDITEPDQVPKDLWTTPEPQPDKAAIKAAIKTGRSVPGASMIARNSQHLVIRGKKQ